MVGSLACASTSNGQPEKLSPEEKKIEFSFLPAAASGAWPCSHAADDLQPTGAGDDAALTGVVGCR